jgi:hypothetical protein
MDINWTALAPIIVVAIAFVIFCLVDIARHDVKYIPRWVWALICCLSVPLGGIIYLLVGRDSGSSR